MALSIHIVVWFVLEASLYPCFHSLFHVEGRTTLIYRKFVFSALLLNGKNTLTHKQGPSTFMFKTWQKPQSITKYYIYIYACFLQSGYAFNERIQSVAKYYYIYVLREQKQPNKLRHMHLNRYGSFIVFVFLFFSATVPAICLMQIGSLVRSSTQISNSVQHVQHLFKLI